ncbi:MAG: efflux RND transporter permease subunit [Gammaproteobacteria bacterium]|nr:efflux RND transporter permease subunit [Gammaproteobacteria bacterium]
MSSMMRFLVERGLMVNLISIMLVVLGLYAAFNINREAFPNVSLDQVSISAVYPGATPEEIEKLIVTPVEQQLKALSGVDKITSVSFPGSASITLELDPDATNRDRITSDVQLAVDRAVLPNDMPAEPSVLEIDGAVFPIIQLAISGDLNELVLKRIGDDIADDVLNIPGIARVTVQGSRKAELRITIDEAKMKMNRVSIGEIATLLAKWNINAPGGEIDTPEGQKAVRVVGEFKNPEDVGNLVIRANERGDALLLKDVADITEELQKARLYYDVQGTPALNMIVMKKTDADIITTVDAVRVYVDTITEKYGEEVHVNISQDMSKLTRMRLGVLTNNGIVGLILVFLSLLLFLRPSVALTTTWGLPIVFLSGLFVLWISGVTLNMISMLGFIMVLGMLVDDAIIIGENITYHMEKGMPPREAAVVGSVELLGPVTATVLTTILAFLPMMFVSGIIGKFIVAIPVVVCLLLFFSWLESFLVLPSHVASVAKASSHPKERAWLVFLENVYGSVLTFALRFRWLTVLLSFAILAGSMVIAKNSTFMLFPPVGVDQYLVRVTAEPGTSLQAMREKMQQVDIEIRKRVDEEYLETTLASVGQVQMDAGDPLKQRGARFAQTRVIYTPAISRPEHDALDDMHRIEKELPGLFPDLTIAFSEMRPGPPTGRALEIEIAGDDDEASEQVARNLMAFLHGVKGVTSVESGLQAGDKEVHVVVDRVFAAYAGVDLSTVASHVRAAVNGLIVGTTRRGTEELDITIRYPQEEDQLKVLKEINIPNQRGGLVPLSQLAKLEESEGFTTIRHKQGVRVVSVIGNVDTSIITSMEINALVAEKQVDWVGEFARKVDINYGGEAEKNTESIKGLAFSFLFAMIGIFFILAIQFNNVWYPFFVMLAIPFGAIGIIISFQLHDAFWKPMPLSFFAMMGMVALAGVVVNSSLVLLVFVQRAIADGMHYIDALLLAGRRRLRAVILTAATTVVGLLPTAYGWGGSDPFVAPMALALSSGLLFATVVTLITIPAAFAVGMDVRELWLRLLGKIFRRGSQDKELAEKV